MGAAAWAPPPLPTPAPLLRAAPVHAALLPPKLLPDPPASWATLLGAPAGWPLTRRMVASARGY